VPVEGGEGDRHFVPGNAPLVFLRFKHLMDRMRLTWVRLQHDSLTVWLEPDGHAGWRLDIPHAAKPPFSLTRPFGAVTKLTFPPTKSRR
jgi:hypothetical protein